MIRSELILLGTLVLTGPTLCGDDGGAKAGKPHAKKAAVSAEEAAALFDHALASCCATGACAESGACTGATGATEAEECAPCEAGQCKPAMHASPMEELLALAGARPDAIVALLPRVEERFLAEDAAATQRAFLVELLARAEADAVLEAGEELYAARPDAFGEGSLVTFASRGSEAFTDDLEELAREGRVLPCAFFATRGEYGASERLVRAARKHLLREARSRSLDAGSVRDRFVAAETLAALGEEEPLAALRERVHRAVLSALDGGRLDEARGMALHAEFFARGYEYGRAKGLGALGGQVRRHVATRSREVETADEVFELIEAVTPM